MYSRVYVTDAYEAEEVLQSERLWSEPVDDLTLEVFSQDFYMIVDVLANYGLLAELENVQR